MGRPPTYDADDNPLTALGKFASFTDRYRVLFTLLWIALLAIGFSLETPAQRSLRQNEVLQRQQTQIDTLQNQVHALQAQMQQFQLDIANIRQQNSDLKDQLQVLLNLSCVDPTISQHDKKLSGLKCSG